MGSWGHKREGELGPGAGWCAGAILYQAPSLWGLSSPRLGWRQACGVMGLPAQPSHLGHGLSSLLPHG